jgi:hypothetical protein
MAFHQDLSADEFDLIVAYKCLPPELALPHVYG